MTEIFRAIGQAVGGAVKAIGPAVSRVPVAAGAPVVRAAPAAAGVAKEVGAGLGAVKELVPARSIIPKIAQNTVPFLAKVDMIAASGDGHKALSFLAFGNVRSEFAEQVAAKIPQTILRHDFVALEQLGPESMKGLTRDVAGLTIPKNVLDDPVFAQQFFNEFRGDVAKKKDLLKKGQITPEDYIKNRQQMLKESAMRAQEKKNKTPDEKELEEIKRKAALNAIRQQMLMWRQSVMQDKRLTPDAKQHALVRINKLESRLILQESIRWKGLSVVKALAVAAMYIEEVAS